MSASAYPPRPPSEVEWEELLVRYEIAPRALALALADHVEPVEARLRTLRRLVEREQEAARLLAAMRGAPTAPSPEVIPPDASLLAQRFTELRGRNFAALQRRGLEVWEWRTSDGGEELTAHQLLQGALAHDGAALAALRAAPGEVLAC